MFATPENGSLNTSELAQYRRLSTRPKLVVLFAALLIALSSALFAPQQAQAAETDWNIRTTFISGGGDDVPLRWGRADTQGQVGTGWNHMVSRGHASEATYNSWVGHIEYVLDTCNPNFIAGKATCARQMEGNPDYQYVVVFTDRVDPASGDGRPVGVVTAYLQQLNCGC
ncbi:hypothetical protein [Pseudoclavibacter sp. VKM Ac-2888]|uniref:hypothetical protein n=1 Tax=Pseudoclavibacter sp. VKM Ac-2888 TaxID=2783830 RepID=UPI00188C6DDA|nr:hypothetical protein [Pseudoclavibacter sp. VKM Ac-2888]MBF4549326.1 hypothetical protein [Pseudoclavibacter sp. VKM Ac-2888]